MLAATTRSSGLQDRTPCVQERLPNGHQGGRDPRRMVFRGQGLGAVYSLTFCHPALSRAGRQWHKDCRLQVEEPSSCPTPLPGWLQPSPGLWVWPKARGFQYQVDGGSRFSRHLWSPWAAHQRGFCSVNMHFPSGFVPGLPGSPEPRPGPRKAVLMLSSGREAPTNLTAALTALASRGQQYPTGSPPLQGSPSQDPAHRSGSHQLPGIP